MEDIWWRLVTAVAPVAWGANYYVTHEFLPPDRPFTGAAVRALPAGLLLLAVRPRRPRGAWWWRAPVLGALNMSAFFTLIYFAAQSLPTGLASTIMATSPVVLMLMAWPLVGERPAVLPLAGAAVGIAGTCLMLLSGPVPVSAAGASASVAAMALSSLGYILAKRWNGEVDVLASTSWQLIAGGLLLIPPAVAVEGVPPALGGEAIAGFGYVTVVATAIAFAAWFAGLKRLPAATVGLIGLLNPVTGVLLGTVLAAEAFTPRQVSGMVLVLAGLLLGQPLAARLRPRGALASAPAAVPSEPAARAADAIRAPGQPALETGRGSALALRAGRSWCCGRRRVLLIVSGCRSRGLRRRP